MKLETINLLAFEIVHACDSSSGLERRDFALGVIDLAFQTGLLTEDDHERARNTCMYDYNRMYAAELRTKSEEDIRRELGFPFQEPYKR